MGVALTCTTFGSAKTTNYFDSPTCLPISLHHQGNVSNHRCGQQNQSQDPMLQTARKDGTKRATTRSLGAMKLSKAGARICSIEEQKFWNVANTQLQVSRKRHWREKRERRSFNARAHVHLGEVPRTCCPLNPERHPHNGPWRKENQNVGTIRILQDHYWFHRNLNWLRVPLCCLVQILRGLSCGRDLGPPSRVLVR